MKIPIFIGQSGIYRGVHYFLFLIATGCLLKLPHLGISNEL